MSLQLYQVSWNRKLRQKFKNLQPPARAEIAGIDVPVCEKKRKVEVPSEEPTSSDIAEHEQIFAEGIQFAQMDRDWHGYPAGGDCRPAQEVEHKGRPHSGSDL